MPRSNRNGDLLVGYPDGTRVVFEDYEMIPYVRKNDRWFMYSRDDWTNVNDTTRGWDDNEVIYWMNIKEHTIITPEGSGLIKRLDAHA